jgi:hypothetical protein
MDFVFAVIGFVGGVVIGMVVFVLVINGGRRATYQLMTIRHPWIRLVSILWIVACGVVVAIVAY